jgi:hypothetical protein
MAMRDKEQGRWDVRLPENAAAKGENKLKALISGLVLLALVAGPILVTKGKESGSEGLGPESSGAPAAQAAAVSWDGEAGDKTKEEINRADSTGAQHGRYFPGRQAM